MSTVLPMRYYRDPADAVAFEQSRALFKREGCLACRNCDLSKAEPCQVKKRPGKRWCEGFDEA